MSPERAYFRPAAFQVFEANVGPARVLLLGESDVVHTYMHIYEASYQTCFWLSLSFSLSKGHHMDGGGVAGFGGMGVRGTTLHWISMYVCMYTVRTYLHT